MSNEENTSSDKDDAALKAGLEARKAECYVFRLFVIGTSPRSDRAVVNVRRLCEEHLQNRYKLEVIDISQDPTQARDEQILAAPTLIKELPLPLRRFIGDMSKTENVIVRLDLDIM